MYPRKHILKDNSLAHVYFRCHNREHFFKSSSIKLKLLLLWAKYHKIYKVNIIEFIIMDNHCHLVVKVDSVESLSHFMRTTNSQLARYINKLLNRDSQAIRERFKSPLITSHKYLLKCIQYVWLNRYKVDGKDPSSDRYCSVSWRLNKKIIQSLTQKTKDLKLLKKMLSGYGEVGLGDIENTKNFFKKLLSNAVASASTFASEFFNSGHTIGNEHEIKNRTEYLSAFRREKPPWSRYLVQITD